MGFKVTIEGGA